MSDYTDSVPQGEVKMHSRTKQKIRVRRGAIDVPFLLLTLIILTIGVIMVLSASFANAYYSGKSPTYYFTHQLIFAASGLVLMYLASLLPTSFYKKWSPALLLISLIMLLLVPFIGVGKEDVGANRWFDFGFTTFQPSELAKLAVILMFARMICLYRNKMDTFLYGVVPFGVILALIVILLFLEPHISACVIILAVGAIMMFAGGTRIRYFGVGLALVILAGIIAYFKFDYVASRINIWQHPESDPLDDGFQTLQSLYAIGSGGLLGLGFGQSRQKYLYLPEEHNDFIFSIVCEELGFIGAALILILFALLIVRGYWLAMHARDRFGALVTIGITSLLAIQVFLNIAVVTNFLPCTGISLPFFSYGGSALWIQLVEIGILLSISREIPLRQEEKEGSGNAENK